MSKAIFSLNVFLKKIRAKWHNDLYKNINDINLKLLNISLPPPNQKKKSI